MKKFFTTMMVAVAALTATAEDKVLFDNPDASMLSWSVACSVSASDVSGIKAGDVIEVTVSEVKADCEWPKLGFESGSGSDYPEVFEMWTRRDNLPYVGRYIVTEAALDLLSGGFDIKGDGVTVTKVVYVSNSAEEQPKGQTLLFDNPDASMLSWSVACSVTAAQVSGIKAGDVIEVTVAEVKADCEWPKFGFENGSGSNYPEAFEMWTRRDNMPYVAKFVVTEADVELLSGGFDIKGDGVRLVKAVYISNESEELPEGTVLIYSNEDASMLSWSVACSVTAAQVSGIKAGDMFEVTVADVNADCEWPKFGFEANGKDNYPEAFQMWEHRDNLPYVATYYVTADDVELLSGGFDIKGDGVRITKVLFISQAAGGDTENVLWKGEPVAMTWGDVNAAVSAGKAAVIKAGDVMSITVSSIGGSEWPKVLCRCEDGWEEIFTIELSADEADQAPLVKNVEVTEAMLPMLHKGFFFGGEGASIEKVTLTAGGNVAITEVQVSAAPKAVGVYTVSGVRVRVSADSDNAVSGLPAGLYIVNGKKVIVK